jgi:hypothetical protein
MKKYTLLTVLLFGLVIQKTNAQSSSAFNTYHPGYYLGWSGSAPDLNFATSGTAQMTLTDPGDLNIDGAINGYQIYSSPVLSTEGDITSIFVGEQLPIPYGPFSNQYNTIVGYSAGNNMMVGVYNTLSGSYAGTNVNIK